MKANDLALQAARKRQSPETGFVHYSYEIPGSRDTIPLFENFCFALALFKTRTAENILEGKALLEKLLMFQVGDNFPIYVHEFPLCRNPKLGSSLYPVVFWLLKDFSLVLAAHLKEQLEKLLQMLVKPVLTKEASSPEEWAEFLILAQIEGIPLEPALKQWHPTLFTYLGPQKQEKFEPALTLYDIFLGEFTGEFSLRALQDHPSHMRASLVQPYTMTKTPSAENQHLSHPLRFMWGTKEGLHSFVLETKGAVEQETIYLQEGLVEDEIEVAFFVSAFPENTIWVEGLKANSFQLGDHLDILSQDKKLTLKLSLISGEGRFFGQIFKANRPGQLCCKKDNSECYDWKLSLRTLKRTGPCQIRATLSVN